PPDAFEAVAGHAERAEDRSPPAGHGEERDGGHDRTVHRSEDVCDAGGDQVGGELRRVGEWFAEGCCAEALVGELCEPGGGIEHRFVGNAQVAPQGEREERDRDRGGDIAQHGEAEPESDLPRSPGPATRSEWHGSGRAQSVTPRAAATVCMSLSPRPLSPMRMSLSGPSSRATCMAW